MAPPKKSKKTQMKKKGLRKRRTVAKSPANSCKVVEFYKLGDFNCNESYDFAVNGIIPLTNPTTSSRAAQVAPAFGLYRIAQVEYKITPKFDTYVPTNSGTGNNPVELPLLYWKMNRFGDDVVGFNDQNMMSMGSKPIRLDDKTITIKYKPNILLANTGDVAQGLAGGSGSIKMTPWLNTGKDADETSFQLSTTEHVGHLMYIEAAAAGTGVGAVCEVMCRIVYEFKNPRIVEPDAAQKRPHVKVTGNVKTQVITLEQSLALTTQH